MARENWAYISARSGAHVDISIPPYFIDRYAYRAYKKEVHGQASLDDVWQYVAVPEEEWRNRLCRVLVGAPSLGMPPVNPDDHIPHIPLLHNLLQRWRVYLRDNGVWVGESYFQNPAGKKWIDFYRNSVHYPNPPAIRGPTFAERLSSNERAALIDRVDVEGVLGLYIFLSQIHEEVHLIQRGEPLLNEIHLAWLWCRFLDAEGLWWWQRSEDFGESFNIEQPWVSQLTYGADAPAQMLADSYLAVRSIVIDDTYDSTGVYDRLCEIAWQFDRRKFRYREYLNRTINTLQNTSLRYQSD
ncbi:MAG: hypothetical protein ACXU9J_03040 [Syntrophales bacterium]